MKMPPKCPYCNDTFVCSYSNTLEQEVVVKSCTRPSHHIKFLGNSNTEDVELLTIWTYGKIDINANWFFSEKKPRLILRDKDKIIDLPFFEPDVSNIRKLIKKIKTYILLS